MTLPRLLATVLLVEAMALPARAPAQHAPTAPPASPAALADTARVRKWRDDVRFITERIRTQHPRPFTKCPQADFDSAARAIEARIAGTDDTRLAVECMRMVALLGDGHTLLIGTLPHLGFTSVLPIALRPFEDGLFVAAADPAYAAAVGAKVLKVGNLTAAEALARVASATSADNPFTALDRAPLFLMMPDLLHALGIAASRTQVTLELEDAGGAGETVTIRGAAPPEGFPHAFLESEPHYPASWTSARTLAPGKMPRCDQRPGEAWWFQNLPESKALYLRMRRVEPVSEKVAYFEFYRELFSTLDSLRPAALIVDLRQNHGGNNTVVDPLVRGIQERPWLNREGGLFALIDRGTFSAAMNAAVFLDDQTRARFVGEPTGGGVNHYGDAPEGQTPNFGMMFQVSTIPWLARFPQDPRPFVAPDIAVLSTFANWRAGRDVAMEAAIDAASNGTLAVRVLETVRRGGAMAGKEAYDAWWRGHPSPWEAANAGPLVQLASDLGDRGQWSDAAALAEVAVLADARSGIAWRLLGEAEMHLGHRARAVECLRKTLEINPRAQIARLMLERIERP